MVVEFIDSVRARFGVEPICRVLSEHGVPIAPSGYYAHRGRPASARARRDELLTIEIERIFYDRNLGRGLAGVRKMWRLLARQIADGKIDAGLGPVARCTVERLMRKAGLQGARRGRQFVTTRADAAAARPPDLVERDFHAEHPNQLWVVDFERHEAPGIRVEVKGLHRRVVAAARFEAEGSLIRETPGRAGSSPDNAGTVRHCQTGRVRQA